jgi:hypothetical protein
MSQGGDNGQCEEQAEHRCRGEQPGLQFIHVIDPSLKWSGREKRANKNPGQSFFSPKELPQEMTAGARPYVCLNGNMMAIKAEQVNSRP